MKRITIILAALALFAAALPAMAAKPGAHWVTEPVCTVSVSGVQTTGGNAGKGGTATVSCTAGKVAGLGSAAVNFNATFPGSCENSGEHEPGGHLQAGAQVIQPKGGNILTPAWSDTVTCSNGLFLAVGDTVTYLLTRNGEVVFEAFIPITMN